LRIEDFPDRKVRLKAEAIAYNVAMQKTKKRYAPELKQFCKELYVKGLTIADITKQTVVPERTLYQWRDAGDWDNFCPPDSVEVALARRICRLSEKETKTKLELDELARLIEIFGGMSIKLATAEKIKAEGRGIDKGLPRDAVPGAVTHDGEPRPRREKKSKTIKNDISGISPEMLDTIRERTFYRYQKLWYERKNDPLTRRIRFILKSRQIGATYYFAFEALDDAIRTGDNQVFLSASRDQAEVFKAYIIAFAKNEFEVELKGTGFILLSNGAELRFLSTNSTTAQSYHGHLYIDEVFWIPNFDKTNKIASGIAAHKKWRKTYFSTPSAQGHQAYKLWTGDKYTSTLPEKKRVPFDVSRDALNKTGALFADGIWRHIVTVEDAEQQGCDLFDIAQLRLEYSKDEFDNLFLCKFIDDSQSVFSLNMLLNCLVENEQWDDYDPHHSRPFGNRPVALGYDPSRSEKGDDAQLSVLSIPLTPTEPFRLLRRRSCRGRNFDFQANRIKEDVDLHNVQFIGLDVNGLGVGIVEHVEKFFPRVTAIHYSQEAKNRLIVKALDLINTGRFKLLKRDDAVISSFLMIKQSVSNGNGSITYTTDRSAESGHGDSAWSVINAFSYEPLAGNREGAKVTFGQ
jgi:uncharacterized protein YjcR